MRLTHDLTLTKAQTSQFPQTLSFPWQGAAFSPVLLHLSLLGFPFHQTASLLEVSLAEEAKEGRGLCEGHHVLHLHLAHDVIISDRPAYSQGKQQW